MSFPRSSNEATISYFYNRKQKHNDGLQMHSALTPNRPLAHTSFTYRKLNLDGFCVLNGFLGYPDSTQIFFLKFLHAQGVFQTS